MRRALQWIIGALAAAFLGSAIVGAILGGGILHPARRTLDAALIAQANDVFVRDGVVCQEFDVTAQDGVILRGWRVHAKSPKDDWVMLFHGQSDNRVGAISYADFLLRAGYSVVMMDARAHGASGGTMATYGWKERWDTKSIVAALYATENPGRLFALGESMGGAIALQSAAVEPRISAVVAEASFAICARSPTTMQVCNSVRGSAKRCSARRRSSRSAPRKKRADFALTMYRLDKLYPSVLFRCC